MTWLEAFGAGAANVFSWPGILIPIVGTLVAMTTSFLPGIGNTSIVVLLIAATMTWDPASVMLLFGALTGGATFMGSITAILFNIPGNVASTPTLLDGHPLARRGLARTAIACAATASAVGSVIGVLVLIALLPAMRPLLLEFGPIERLLVCVWGLATIVALPSGSRWKAAAMTMLGLLAAAVGPDPSAGPHRWDVGGGHALHALAVMLGVFTLSELIDWMRHFHMQPAAPVQDPQDSTRRGIKAVFTHWALTLRCSVIGTVIGIIPGVGGTVAGFVAYGHAVQSADDRSQFGQGDIRGVVGPEAAVDAKDGGSLLPALAFGLPGSEAGVTLLAVFAIHGLVPGAAMLTTHLPITFTLILALLFSNIFTSVVGVALTPWLARLRNLPIERVALACLVITLVTVVQVNGDLFDLYTALVFGIAGCLWRTHDWPRAPFIIAFILGSLIEANLALSVQLVQLGRADPFGRPGALLLLLLLVASAAWMLLKDRRKRKEEKPGGIGIAAVSGGVSALAFVIAVAGHYPAYTIAVSAGATFVCGWVAVQAWRGEGPPSFKSELAIEPGRRLPLALMTGLGPAIWLLGLVGGVGVTVAAWHFARAGLTRTGFLRAAASSAGYMLATYWFIEEAAHLILPPGIIWP